MRSKCYVTSEDRYQKFSSVCVCVFFPFILDIKFVGRTSRGHTGGRSHRIFYPPSFCGACLNFSREKDSAIPFPRQPWSRILCTNDFNRSPPVGHFYFCFLVFKWEKSRLPGSNSRPNVSEGYEVPLSYRGDRLDCNMLYHRLYVIDWSDWSVLFAPYWSSSIISMYYY